MNFKRNLALALCLSLLAYGLALAQVAPVLDSIGAKSVNEGQTLQFRIHATDANGDPITFSVVNNPANSSLFDSLNGAGTFTFNPDFTQANTYNVTFIATDTSGLADSEVVVITVNNVNQAPVLAPIGAKSVDEGQGLVFRISGSDPDGPAPTFAVVNNPTNSSLFDSLNGAGTFTFNPDFTQANIYNVTFIASDGSLADTEIVAITVNNVNQAPVLATIGAKSVTEGQALTFRFSATDPDGTFPSFTVVNNPTNSSFVDSLNGAGSFTFSPSFTQAGLYNVTFIASDGTLADTEIVAITVNEAGNQRPVLAAIGAKSVTEGQTLTFRFSATDADGTFPSFAVVNNPTNSSFADSANGAGSFTFNPSFTQAGLYNVTFIASDGTLADTEIVAITVNEAGNQRPVLATIGAKSVTEGQALTFRFSATDADGTFPSFTVLNNPTNSSFVDSANGAGSFTFNPSFTQAGLYNVTFIASDGSLADTEIVAITVNEAGNQFPVLAAIGAKSVNEGQALQFRFSATDPDGTFPALTVVGNPANSSFVDSLNGAASFTFNPDFTQSGVYNVSFIASDGTLADTEIVAITVNNVNRSPVLDSIGPESVNEGQTLLFRVHATDLDGTPLTLTVVNNPLNSNLVDSLNGAGSFAFNPDFTQSGVYNVTFIASDGSLADSEVVQITVNNVNRPPVLAAIGAKSVTEGQNLTFRFSATDPDGTFPSFTVLNNPTNSGFADSANGAGSFTFNPSFIQAGVYNVTFIASDGSLADTEVVAITVNEAGNQRPVLAAIGAKSVTEGQNLTFRFSATDPDGTFPSFTVLNNPTNSSFADSANGAGSFTFNPSFTQAGVYNVTFIASDGTLADTEIVAITVSEAGNQRPVLAAIGAKSVTEGQNLTFRFSSTDSDGTFPSFTVVNNPTNSSFVDSTNGAGSFTFNPSFTQAGLYNVTFIASDGSLADTEIVAITVNEAGNQFPVLAAIGAKSVTEAQTLTFRFSATDADGITPSLTIVNNPTNSSFVDSLNGAGSFTFNPSFTQAGLYNVTFIASDGTLADTEIVAITVNEAGNQRPVLAAIGAKSVTEGQNLTFRFSATDPDGTFPSFTVLNNPTNSGFADSANGAGSFTFNPSFTQAGLYNVTFIASDGSLADTEIVAITVNEAGNQFPVLAAIGAKSINEGQTLQFRFSGTDPDGTFPALSVVGNPANSSFVDSLNGAASFTFNPDFTQSGVYNVTFIASDGSLADSEIVVITVNNVNRSPVLDSIGPKNVNEGQTLLFRVHATDLDGTPLTFTVVNNPLNSNLVDSLNGAGSFTFNPSFAQSGVYNVTFIASDGSLADSEVVQITVNNVNRPPVLAGIGSKSVNEGQTLQFRISATDPDGTSPNFTVVNNPLNSNLVDSLNGAGSFTFNPSFAQSGVYNVTFIASDGSLADSEVVQITVNNVNRPPVLAGIGSKSVNEGQILQFRVSATDLDGTSPNFTVVNNPLNSNLVDSLNGAGSFTFNPSFAQSGVYNVTFIASDGSLADSEIVAITVNNVNQAPVLAAIGAKSVTEGQNLTFRFSATDVDGTFPSFTVVNNPTNSSFVDSLNGAGSFNFNPSFTQAGLYNVTFIASDGTLADTEIVAITVNEAGNQRPVLAAIGAKSVTEGQNLTFRFSATDVDGTFPSFTVVNNPTNSSFVDSLNGAGSFNFNPSFTQAGLYNVTFIASDGTLADTEIVAITVNEAGNQRPVLAAIGAKSVTEGQTLSFRFSATDADGTTPSLTVVNNPTNSSFIDSLNGAGSFSFSPNFTQAGVYNVRFIASDGTLADTEIVAITVNEAGNQRPVLAAIGAKSVTEGQALTFRFSATDVDGTTPSLTVVNNPTNSSFVDSLNGAGSFTFNPSFTQAGLYNVTFIASDGTLADTEIVAITVNDAGNQRPVLAAIGAKSVTEGQALTFRFSATDPDGTFPSFAVVNNPTNSSFADSANGAGSFTFNPSFTQAGLYNVTFIASDGTLADTEIVAITVNEAGNQRPVLAAIGAKSVTEGQALTFRFSATDADGTIPNFTVVNNPPNSNLLDSLNGAGRFTFNPSFSQAGVYNVTFVASDGSLADSEVVQITVVEAGNQRPVLAGIGTKIVTEGQTLQFRISATDPDGTFPSLVVVNNPANSSSVDSGNGAGSFTFMPSFTQAGLYNVIFIATDGSLADSEIVSIIVNEAGNQKPILANIGPKSVTEAQTLTFRVSATDPDGATPSLTAINRPTNSSFVDSTNGAGSFTFTPSFTQAGTYNVTFIASDGNLADSEVVTITVIDSGNQRPVLASIGPKSVTEGQLLQFRLSATDPDGTFPNFTAVNNPPNSNVLDSLNGAGSFTFNPSFTQAGAYNVTFIASDGSLADSEVVVITVNEAGNQRPVLAAIGAKSVTEGQTLTFRFSATDPDGTFPSFAVLNNPTNSSFIDSANGAGSFTFSPSFTQAGLYNVTFIASDGTLADTEIVAVTVNDAGNQRPVLAAIGAKSVTEGQTLQFRISATDADGTIPNFTVANNPPNSNLLDSLNGAGRFLFNPSFTQAGVYNVTFIASDGSLADSEVVVITVNEAGSQRPVLATIGAKSVTEGQTLTFRFSATDPDGTFPSFTVLNNPTNSSFVDSTNGAGSFTFNPSFTQAGLYNVTFIASDGTLADTEIVAITVNDAGNQRPVLAAIGAKSVTEGQTLTFRFSATDPDGTFPSFTVLNNPTNSSFADSANGAGSFTFSPSFTQAGLYNVTFIASDGTLADTEIVAITVNEAGNQRPVLAAIGAKSVTEGQTLQFRFSATDVDGTTPVLTVVNNPTNSSFVDSLNGAGSFSFSPNFTQAGVYNVRFIASDGTLADTEIVAITVNDAGNQRPVLAAIGPKSVTEGQLLQFRLSATDPDGTFPNFTAVNNPPNSNVLDSLNGAGSFTFNPSFTQAGAYNVTFIASDGTLADTEIVAITVNEAGNQRPVLAAIGPKSVNEGQNLTFRFSATDADGTTPSLTVVNNPTNSSFIDSLNRAGSFSFSPNFTQAGVYNVRFIASDGTLADTEIVAITVNESGNQRPVLAAIGAKSVTEGQNLTFRFSAIDPDGTFPSFTVLNNPTNSSFADSANGAGSFTFNPSFTQAGLYNVTFIASDGTLADTEIVAITVNESGNQRPVLAAIGAKSVTEGQNLTFRFSAIDPDGTFPSFTVLNNPTNSSFADSAKGAGSFTFNPSFTQAGLYNVTFIASDGTLADTEIVAITVNEAGNQKPVLAVIGAKSVTEGQNLTFRFSAIDPDGTFPSFTVLNNPTNSSFADSANGAGSFTFNPSFTQAGVYNVTFIASDGSLSDTEVVAITVNDAGNQRPVLAAIGAKSVTEGQTLQFRISATDADGTIPNFTVVNNPPNSNLLDSLNGAGRFLFNPSFTQAGVYNVTFIASDGSLADSEVVVITVNEAGNQAPVLATIGAKSVTEGQTLQFRFSATDPDGNFPALTVVNNPTNSSFADSANGAGSFTFNPNFAQAGVYNVTFIASDVSLADTEVVQITVTEAGNQRPVLAAIGAKSVNEGQTLQFRVSAADADGAFPSFTAVNNPPNSNLIDSLNGAGSFTFNPSSIQAGLYNVTFIASDGSLADSETVQITVNNVNQAPVLDSIGPKSVAEGGNLNIRVTASDVDGNAGLILAAINPPLNSTFVDSGNGIGRFNFSPSASQAGTYNVTFRVSDGLTADSEIVTITVTTGPNQPPVLVPIGFKIVTEGILLQFRISATDPDGTTPQLKATGIPRGGVFVDSGNGAGSFSWTPDYAQAGLYNVKFSATDAQSKDDENVLLQVRDAGNQRPVLFSIGPKTVTEGQVLNFTVSAADPDSTIPALFADSLPANAFFTDLGTGNGNFLFEPNFVQAGSYQVLFRTFDGSLADSELVTITVLEAGNQAPVWVVLQDSFVISENSSGGFNVTAADPDSTIPRLRAANMPANASFADSANGRGRFNFSPSFDQQGNYYVRFLAKDFSDTTVVATDSVKVIVRDVNRKPAFTQGPIPDQSVNEGDSVTINISASDPDGTIPVLGFRAENASFQPITLPNATFTDNSNGTGLLKFKPDFNQTGVYFIAFLARDQIYPADTTFFLPKVRITVNNTNRAPVIANRNDTSLVEGDSLEFVVSASDPDVTVPTLSAQNLPRNATFTPNINATGRFKFKPVFNQAGVYAVSFIASDGSLADTEVVNITVIDAGNHPPVILTAIPDSITLVPGSTYKLRITATDPDSTVPTLSALPLPANAVFVDSGGGKGGFVFTPDSSQADSVYSVVFRASDGSLQDLDTLKLSVNNFIRGDCNADGKILLSDVIYLVNFIFHSGPAPQPLASGDANANGSISLSDVIYLVNYIFKGGPPPPP